MPDTLWVRCREANVKVVIILVRVECPRYENIRKKIGYSDEKSIRRERS